MLDVMPDRLPWFVAGPLLGLLIVALYAVANKPMGAVGAYMQTLALIRGGGPSEQWRVWFFGGIVAGGSIATLLRGDLAYGVTYGSLGREVAFPVLVIVLVVAGALMGFGARWARGCNMGHGLSGSAIRSPGSLIAAATFMTAAIAVTWLIHLVIGGAL